MANSKTGEPKGFPSAKPSAGATARDSVTVHVLGFDQITRENFRVKLQAQAALTGGRDPEGLPLGFFLNGILLGKTAFDDFGVADIALTIDWAALQKGNALTVKVKGMEQAMPVAWDVPKSPMQLEAEERERQERARVEQQRRDAEEQARQEKIRLEEQKRQEEERKRQEKIWEEQRKKQAEEQAKQERIRAEEQRRQAEEQARQQKIRGDAQRRQERNEKINAFFTASAALFIVIVGKLFFLGLTVFFAYMSFFFYQGLIKSHDSFIWVILFTLSVVVMIMCFGKIFTFNKL